jgi:hypothetical protein
VLALALALVLALVLVLVGGLEGVLLWAVAAAAGLLVGLITRKRRSVDQRPIQRVNERFNPKTGPVDHKPSPTDMGKDADAGQAAKRSTKGQGRDRGGERARMVVEGGRMAE